MSVSARHFHLSLFKGKKKDPAGPNSDKLDLSYEVLLPLLSAGPKLNRAACSFFTRTRTVIKHKKSQALHEKSDSVDRLWFEELETKLNLKGKKLRGQYLDPSAVIALEGISYCNLYRFTVNSLHEI